MNFGDLASLLVEINTMDEIEERYNVNIFKKAWRMRYKFQERTWNKIATEKSEIQTALEPEYDVSDDFRLSCSQCMTGEPQNLIILVLGLPGTGKSDLGASIGFWLAEDYARFHQPCMECGGSTEVRLIEGSDRKIREFTRACLSCGFQTRGILYPGRTSEPVRMQAEDLIHLSFSDGQTQQYFNDLSEGHVALQDEKGYLSGENKTTTLQANKNVMTSQRGSRISFIYCDPKKAIIEMVGTFNFLLVCVGWKKTKSPRDPKYTRALVYALDEDPTVKSRSLQLIGHIIVKLHDHEAWRQRYLALKDDYNASIRENRGQLTVDADVEKMERDEKRLADKIQVVLKKTGRQKLTVRQIHNLARKIGIAGTNQYVSDVIGGAELRLALEDIEDDDPGEEEPAVPEFAGDGWGEYAGRYLRERGVPGWQCLVAQYTIEGLGIRKVREELQNELDVGKSPNTIAAAYRDLSARELGYAFEYYYPLSKGAKLEGLDLGGNEGGKPDWIDGPRVYSIKHRHNTDAKIWFSQSDDCSPEQNYVRDVARLLEDVTTRGLSDEVTIKQVVTDDLRAKGRVPYFIEHAREEVWAEVCDETRRITHYILVLNNSAWKKRGHAPKIYEIPIDPWGQDGFQVIFEKKTGKVRVRRES